jgi:uncharacterized repeat protein (TIGR01451 family)
LDHIYVYEIYKKGGEKVKLLLENNQTQSSPIVETNTTFVLVNGVSIANTSCSILMPSIALKVIQTASKSILHRYQYLTYNIEVINNGPSDATGVILKDILPSSVNLVSTNISTGTFIHSKNTLTWNIVKLSNNTQCFAQITIIPQKPGTISNYIIATANEFNTDPNYYSTKNVIVT